MPNAQIMSVVQKRGKNQGIVISSKIKSTAQIKIKFITKLKNPRVIILKGRVIVFKIGFKNTLIIPKITPKRIIMCQFVANGNPKKFELGKILILILGTKETANHRPKIPAKI